VGGRIWSAKSRVLWSIPAAFSARPDWVGLISCRMIRPGL
jgi:hypothetical protein